MNRNVIIFGSLLLATFWLATLLGLPRPQALALGLFGGTLYGAIFFWHYRLAFALFAVAAMLVLGLTDIPHLIGSAGLDIIPFLVGMMLVVGFLDERRFFEAFIDSVLGRVGGDGKKLLAVLMVLSAFFTALVDEVTATLFMMAALFQITSRHKLDPLPFLIMLVFAANMGSSATVVGNPIGIVIAMRANLSFADFLRWASPVSFLVLVLTIVLCLIFFAADIKSLTSHLKKEWEPRARETNGNKPARLFGRELRSCWLLFLGTVLALIFHSRLELLLSLPKNTLLLAIALAAGGISLLAEKEKARELLERKVDWWTLSFFMLLFASVGTLQYVGLTESLARAIVSISGQNGSVLFLAVTWGSGLVSAFMDNVLAVSTFIPIIKDLENLGTNVAPLWWGVLFGGTLGGNATMIGSTANIVALGLMERRGLGHVTFGQWLRAGLLITIPTLALASLVLLLQLRP